MGNIEIVSAFQRAWDLFKIDPLRTLVAFLVVAAIAMTVFLGPIALAGFFVYLRKLARNENPDVVVVLEPFSDFRRFFLGGIIWLVAQVLVIFLYNWLGIFSTLLSIAITALMLPYMPILTYTGKEGYDALMDCIAFFKVRWPMAVSVAVAINLLNWLGSIPMFLGLIITLPLSWILIYVCYEQVYGLDDSGMVCRDE
ncbi:MAG: hypothetical protein GY835_26160 [bacterium]|nr:hypothetical protein [bacterium]